MVGEIPSSDACHYMDAHANETVYRDPTWLVNKVVLTAEFVTMSHGDVNWSMAVALLRQASD